ncbi:efflux RND transporter permease subunit [Bacteroides sp.]|uniref:efflux RND transporter permease subunit n=1 Tax=Bacteroides sp. TaxID=29523 RepID=UPI00258C2929|nr:efflux RND transporter permease subunit [Bacteroides sp.]
MLKTFIDRPVLSTVISIFIVVLGVIGIVTLPVEQYPDIAPPTVNISTQYPGANADVIMKSVVIPIEEAVNGVEGMTYMSSSASNSGMASIEVYFAKGVDPDIAAVNVQNLVATVTPILPAEVNKIGVTVKKQLSSYILGISLSSENPDYDGQFIQNYADINLIPQIKRVYGVGDASVMGAKTYSMRVWLKPDVMASYKMNPTEVIAALADQNIEAAPGELGQNSDQTYQYTLRYTGRLESPEEFENIIIRSSDSHILKLKDVANVDLGSLSYNIISKTNGNESVFISISQTAGSNAQEVINNIKNVLDEAAPSFPPGLKMSYLMDANNFLDASISKVLQTLFEALILVFLVVFLFLQDWKSTLIPGIAVPVAIIGTFFFLQVMGFSVNILTLFALVLAIGIVVDDAIIVVEAVHAHMEAGETDPRQAAIAAMKEISPAIVSITLVMSSVFIPVSFIGGTSGVFFRQFGLTLAIAIALSAVNALTLSPALCALFLKPDLKSGEKKKNFAQRFFVFFNANFDAATQKYKSSLHFLGKRGHRWITVAIIITFSGLLYFMMQTTPTGFVPQEDGGTMVGLVSLPPGSSLERTDSVVNELIQITKEVEEINFATEITGVNFLGGMGGIASSYSTIFMNLKHWNERDKKPDDIAAYLSQRTASIPNATFMFFGMPTLQGFGMSTGVEMKMQDKTGGDIFTFYDNVNNFLAGMNQRKEVMVAMTTFNPNFPQREISADIAKIKEAGLTLQDVMTAMQAYIGSMYVSDFNLYGKQYRVMLQAPPEYRKQLEDLEGIQIRTAYGEMAPLTEFISTKPVMGPQALTRFNMFQSMDVTIMPNSIDGYSSGDVINAVKEVAANTLPTGYGYEFSGMTREETSQGSQVGIIFFICIVFVYLLLAALYESYIIPLAVLLSLPIGLAGVFIFIKIFGSHIGIVNNIYVQISMIMLIGLLAKNAILIVEYALQRRQQGQTVVEAAVNGAVARLRPILMTSFALIIGLLPLMFASGAGATGNRSIGISAVGGMFVGTMIGVLVIPTLYIVFQTIQDRFSKKTSKK